MDGEGKRSSRRRWMVLGALAVLALSVGLPPLVSVGRYQRMIAAGISRSIGQPVHMSSVRVQLLPRPGFALSDFAVEEKPGFGAEPILRSASVFASLRLASLLRGELEISRIDFDEASLNLVRASDGTWNFASILVQASHSANAPTGQRYASRAPRFPYIEATRSRINFKQGDEKKPLSFLNADLSVWLENPEQWGLHFRAQPARTDLDLDLADTGVLRIDGTLQRAAALRAMPVQLKAEWSNAPLGQLSRLMIGQDIGWRGDLDIQAEAKGTAESTEIKTLLTINGLHRSEFAPAQPLNVQTTCRASYHKPSSSFEGISCASPVGSGALLLTGYVRNAQTNPQAGLDLEIDRIPAAAVLDALQEVRNGLGTGLDVSGTVNGHFRYESLHTTPTRLEPAVQSSLSGEMGASSLTLAPAGSGRPFTIADVHLLMDSPAAATSSASQSGNAERPPKPIEGSPVGSEETQPALLLEPVRLALGAAAPLTVDGRFTLAGFEFHLRGPGTLTRLRPLSHALGLLSASANRLSPGKGPAGGGPVARGQAGDLTLDLDVRGPWLLPVPDPEHPFLSFTTVGSMTVRNAELTTSYLSQPLTIASAQAVLSPNEVRWTNASIRYGGLEAQGTLEYPIVCDTDPPCPAKFQLRAPALDLGELQSTLLGARQSESGELLREILEHIESHPVLWPPLSGTIQVGTLSSGRLVLNNAIGALQIAGDSLSILSLDGRMLNGALHLTGTMNTAEHRPRYQIDLQVRDASPSAFAGLFDEQWGSGLINVSAEWKMSGLGREELAQSANGTLHWDWSHGALASGSALPVSAQPLLHFDEWSGDAMIEDSAIKIGESSLVREDEVLPLSGTISFNREILLRSEAASPGFSITGTLEHPEVKSQTTEAEAHPVSWRSTAGRR